MRSLTPSAPGGSAALRRRRASPRPAPPAEDAAGAPLRHWLASHGHDACGLRLCQLDGGFGLAAVAERRVREGDAIVDIPLSALLRPAADCAAACAPEQGDWRPLLLTLLREASLGDASAWRAYLATLPPRQPEAWWHPLLWPPGAAEELLQGSLLLAQQQRRLAGVEGDAAALAAAASAARLPPPAEADTRWAAAVVSSRAFALQELPGCGEGDEALALVPWADCLNHGPGADNDALLRYEPEARACRIYAHRSYSAGQQVFDSYGEHLSPGDLLLSHGFAPPLGAPGLAALCRADVPAAWLGQVGVTNGELLGAAGLPPSSALASVGCDGPDPGVLAWARAAAAAAPELAAAGWAAGAPRDRAWAALGHFLNPVSRANEAAALSRLEAGLAAVAAMHEARCGEAAAEEAALAGLEAAGWRPGRGGARLYALRALVAERRAASGALADVRRRMAAL